MKVSNRINFSKKKLRTIYCIHYTASLQKQSEFAKLKKINYKGSKRFLFVVQWNLVSSKFHGIFMDRVFATRNTRHARLFMIKLQLLQLLELACYSGLYVIRAPPCISIGHLLRRRSSSRKVKMHRGLARALFSIKQNVASLDATFYCAPCRYHVVDKLQSAFRSESTSSSPFFFPFSFFFSSKRNFYFNIYSTINPMFQFHSILERNLR